MTVKALWPEDDSDVAGTVSSDVAWNINNVLLAIAVGAGAEFGELKFKLPSVDQPPAIQQAIDRPTCRVTVSAGGEIHVDQQLLGRLGEPELQDRIARRIREQMLREPETRVRVAIAADASAKQLLQATSLLNRHVTELDFVVQPDHQPE